MATFKVVFCGDVCVGKTAIFTQINTGKFSATDAKETRADAETKVKFEVDDGGRKKILFLHLWDTPGNEKYQDIAKNHFQQADAAVIVYDVTCPSSLDEAENWINLINENAPGKCLKYLAANKQDLVEQVELYKQDGDDFI